MLASWSTFFVTGFFLVVCFLLIVIVLIQKNRGSGLSGAFGGVGGHSAFGTKTGDVMTWFTVGFAGLFLLIAVVGNFVFEPETGAGRAATRQPAPAPGLPGAAGEGAAAPEPTSPAPSPSNPAPSSPAPSPGVAAPVSPEPVAPVTATPSPSEPAPVVPATPSETPAGNP